MQYALSNLKILDSVSCQGTDGRTDGPTDVPMDVQLDERTRPLREKRNPILKVVNLPHYWHVAFEAVFWKRWVCILLPPPPLPLPHPLPLPLPLLIAAILSRATSSTKLEVL